MSEPLGPWNNQPQNNDRREEETAGKTDETAEETVEAEKTDTAAEEPTAGAEETTDTQADEEVPPINFDFNPYGDPNAVPPVVETLAEELPPRPRGMAIASLVLGIASLLFCCCFSVITLVPAAVGLILGIIDLKKNHFSGLALAGVICSAIGLLFGLLFLFLTVTLIVSPEFQEWVDELTAEMTEEGY